MLDIIGFYFRKDYKIFPYLDEQNMFIEIVY